MLNKDKIILMTKMTSYVEKRGKRFLNIGDYFRSDYISIHVLKAFVNVTIAYIICFALYILYDFEVFMQDIYKMDLWSFAQNVIVYYIIAAVSFCLLTYLVYAIKFAKARKSLKIYYKNLNKLSTYYRLKSKSGSK